jgi:hypothetical protein
MPRKTPPPAALGAPISPLKTRAKQRHQPTNDMKTALRDWYNDERGLYCFYMYLCLLDLEYYFFYVFVVQITARVIINI